MREDGTSHVTPARLLPPPLQVAQLMVLAGKTSNARTEKVKRLMRKLDQDGDGTVTEQEFVAACDADPAMLECFGTLFGTETSARQGARLPSPCDSRA